MTASDLAELIVSHKYTYCSETELQSGLARVFAISDVPFEAEVRLNVRDRIDFMVGRIGVEVKIDGTATEVMRQLLRYAELPEVDELVLVTSRARHSGIPNRLNGKPVHLASLLASAL